MLTEKRTERRTDWGRGSGGVKSTGVSQSVRVTSRDESQSVPSLEKLKLFKTRELELPNFEGSLPSCSPHSAGYTRTSVHPHFPLAKPKNAPKNAPKNGMFSPKFFTEFFPDFRCVFFCSKNSKCHRKTASKKFSQTIHRRTEQNPECRCGRGAKPLNMPIGEAKVIPKNLKFLQLAVLHLSAFQDKSPPP